MTAPWKPLIAAAAALVLCSCTHSVTGTAVSAVGAPPRASASDGDESLCATVDVPLHWQRWKVRSSSLDRLSEVVLAGGRDALRPAGR